MAEKVEHRLFKRTAGSQGEEIGRGPAEAKKWGTGITPSVI